MFESLESRLLLSASVSNGTLTVTGTDRADQINITQNKQTILVREGSSVTRFSKRDHINSLVVNALGGNDRIKITSRLNATVDAGDGNDLIISGSGDDLLLGGNGKDRILGNAGHDSITGGAGRDALFGGAGDDLFDAFDGTADNLAGGAGNDQARVDVPMDTAWNIENYLSDPATTSGGTLNLASPGSSMMSINSGKLNFGGSATLAAGSYDVATGWYEGSTTFGNGTLNGSALDKTALTAASATLRLTANTGFTTIGTNTGLAGFTVGTTPVAVGDLNLDGVVNIYDFIDLADNSSISVNGTTDPVPPDSSPTSEAPAADPVVLIAPEESAPLDPSPTDANPAEEPATADPLA
ncbi:MAG TPA: LEPR-XLL domain-containing protein [Tepidisphaeraceae bacterium]|jgi:hypothetical protein|nr:LEPR-XLL domain-containing protein [Tepidisphaeraceae bacterium]